MLNTETTLLLGDIHGNTHLVEQFITQSGLQSISQDIILMGDVGIGFYKKDEDDRVLVDLEDLANKLQKTFYILLGNHDNRQTCADWFGVDVDTTHRIVTNGPLRWLTDGSQFPMELKNQRICTVTCYGGAVSLDKHHRTEGKDFWSTETRPPVEVTIDNTKLNLLLTHDVSLYSLDDSLRDPSFKVPSFSTQQLVDEAHVHHKIISDLVDLGFDAHIHGHMHKFYTVARGGVMFAGLANIDGSRGEQFWLFGDFLSDLVC